MSLVCGQMGKAWDVADYRMCSFKHIFFDDLSQVRRCLAHLHMRLQSFAFEIAIIFFDDLSQVRRCLAGSTYTTYTILSNRALQPHRATTRVAHVSTPATRKSCVLGGRRELAGH